MMICGLFQFTSLFIIMWVKLISPVSTQTTCSLRDYYNHKRVQSNGASVVDDKSQKGTYFVEYSFYLQGSDDPSNDRPTLRLDVWAHNTTLFGRDDKFFMELKLMNATQHPRLKHCNSSLTYEVLNCVKAFHVPNVSVEFSNIGDGYYCVLILFGNDDNPRLDKFNTILAHLKSVRPSPVSEPTTESDSTLTIIICVVAVGIVMITVFIFTIYKICSGRAGRDTRPSPIPPIDLKKPTVTILLIYYHDCIHHVTAVKSFANLLNEHNCEVVYDAADYNELAENPTGWISKQLDSCDKVLIVNSIGAYQCHGLWLENKPQRHDQSITNNTFLSAIVGLIHNKEKAHNYNKVINIRFDYTERENVIQSICPGRHYRIPEDLDQLIYNINLENVSRATEYQHLLQFVREAEKCQCLCKNQMT